MQVDLREFRSAYLAEVDEHLTGINGILVELEKAVRENRAAPRQLREAMRLAHTVKGLSAMVGVDPIVAITHRMESVLRAADRAGGSIDERALDALIRATRAIEVRVKAVAENAPVPDAPTALVAELDALDIGDESERAAAALPLDPAIAEKLSASEREQLAQGSASGRRALRVDFVPSPARAAQGLTITTVRERIGQLGEIVKVLPLAAAATDDAPGGLVFAILVLSEADEAALAAAAGTAPESVHVILAAQPPGEPRDLAPAEIDDDTKAGRAGVLRVEVSRVDDAIEKLSALIVTRWRLQHAVDALTAAGAPTRDLLGILAENARQLRDMRAAILRVRMVPVSAMLERLPLVVRGLGKTTGKQLRLHLEGGGAELDKTVAERLFPALVHLVRNAVDHGIELPDARVRAGKDPTGTLRISCATRNRQVEVRIEDDGRGVDAEAVARKAGAPAARDAAALLDLMCRPGLSTRDRVDTTSGRGMGLDIVRKIVVDSLGGELALETTVGLGTAFVLRVPLTIAIVDAFVTAYGAHRYAIPVPLVEEIIEVAADARTFVVRRGEAVPLVDLGEALGTPDGAVARKVALVVRRTHDDPVAFAVDRIVAQQEAVVRPLADPLVSVPGISGSTDLGDGRATLVLDLHGLVARLGRGEENAA